MKIIKFPEVKQTFDYDCGAKSVQSVLFYYGIDAREDEIMRLALTDKRKGTLISGIIRAFKKYRLKTISGKMDIKKIKEFINKEIPVIILLQSWAGGKISNWQDNWKDGHYAVAIGYDSKKIYFEDPYSFVKTYLSYSELEERWHGMDGKKKCFNYGIAVLGKKRKKNIIHMG